MAAPEKTPRRILVVDDEPSVCDAISRLLASEQYEVQMATSGQEALDAFKAAKFDLVILDYEMPMMKGDKVAAAIKAIVPKQPIMMITAYGEALRFAGSFPLQVDQVVNKPFGIEEFKAAVRQLANGPD